ncbi:hypothetical protein EsDP_00002369 [Epichloe bromicola]|uniref:Uncharacterized protein n=1 Tax=Epichloe bromicola TaxID=79588 RepID=A0ABQ0CKK9_9HYPO
MSSNASDAALERRRQQNRDAQRKRRDNLKAQIEELQARNSELEALRESALSAAANNSALAGPRNTSALLTPDATCGSGDGASTAAYEPSVHLNWDEGASGTPSSATSQAVFPNLDDDAFMRDMCVNWNNSTRTASDGAISDPQCRSRGGGETSTASNEGLPAYMSASESGSGPETCDNETAESLFAAYMSAGARCSPSPPTRAHAAGVTLGGVTNHDSNGAPAVQRRASVVGASPGLGIRKSVDMGKGTRTLGLITPGAPRLIGRRDGKRGAMVVAVANRQAAVVRLLIKHGADVNARDEKGRTVLHDAAEKNDAEMMHLLLEHGADPNIADKTGMMPMEIAAFLGNIEALEVLLTATSDRKE